MWFNVLGTRRTLLALFTYTFDHFLVFSMIIFPPPLHCRLSEKEVQLECLFNGEISGRFLSASSPPLPLVFSCRSAVGRGVLHIVSFSFSQLHPTSPASPECQPFRLLTNLFHSLSLPIPTYTGGSSWIFLIILHAFILFYHSPFTTLIWVSSC